MSKTIKRVLSVNDLSVFGKCSQTVVIPILSAMGIEVCPVITAYLSAHTAFESPVITDMTESLEKYLDHLEKLGVENDCVFTGYIYNPVQFDIIKKYIVSNKSAGALIVTDPVMADDGKLYTPFDDKIVRKMRELCLFADIITPNYTEACFLAGFPCIDALDAELSNKLILRLNSLGINGNIIVTGVPFKDGSKKILLGFNGSAEVIDCDYIECEYCGTGDVYAAVLVGNVLNDMPLMQAVYSARDFVRNAVSETKQLNGPSKQGIVFERFLRQEN